MTELARSTTQLGAIIRRTRKAKRLTQAQLGELAGLRQASISTLETGKLTTQLDTLMSVLAALDLELTVNDRSKGDKNALEDIF